MNAFLTLRLKWRSHVDIKRTSAVRVCFAIGLIAGAISGNTPANAAQSGRETGSAIRGVNQNDLLWWFPADTESVVTARGPFRLPVPSEKDSSRNKVKVSRQEIREEFEQQALELLYSRSLDTATSLRGSMVTLAMQGSRHFRAPLPGLEVMDFEGCSIVVFDDRFGERGNHLMQVLGKSATQRKTVGDTRVLVFHEKLEGSEWDYFLALPRSNLLLAANNLSYLQEVLERMTQRGEARALPDQLSEWHFLDPSARFWGLRHYDRTQAEKDPTSPFGDDRTFAPADPKAIGILFALEPNNQTKARLTYFTGDQIKIRNLLTAGTSTEEALLTDQEVITRDGGRTVADPNPEKSLNPRVELRNPGMGVLELVYTIDRSATLSYVILHMEVSLGRGMYF